MKNHTIRLSRILTITAALLFLAVSAVSAGAWSPLDPIADAEGQDEIARTLQDIEALYRFIESVYLYDIDHKAVYDSLAKGLFSALADPYSEYITAEESQDIEDMTRGVYGGIGAYISKPNPSLIDYDDPESFMVKIVAPFLGSPAYKSGLHAGDLISEIDGKKVDEYTVQESAANLRGEPGTVVKLKVHRGSSVFTIEVERAIVEVPTVRHEMIDSIGYMQILEFTPVTAGKVREAIEDFSAAGYTGIIMDLRSNPGGSVDAAVQIADLFLSSSTVLLMESGPDKKESEYRTRSGVTVDPNIPLVIMTNSGTASSSEILAGALKDNGRTAAVIGGTTFGKGLVQNVYPFNDDDYFTITSAQYFTPSGNNIHEVGIVPDIEVLEPELTDEELESFSRLQEEHRIRDFVDEHSDFQDEEVDAFVKELQEEGFALDRLLLRKLIRNEFEADMDFPPIYDLEYDTALVRALEFIRGGEESDD
jgi:carboxyl-terminal processing protease